MRRVEAVRMAVAKRWWWITGALAVGCAGAATTGLRAGAPPKSAPKFRAAPSAVPAVDAVVAMPRSRPGSGSGEAALARFVALVKEQGDLEAPELFQRLGIQPTKEAPLPFDPTKVAYFELIADELKLTKTELELFREHGVVSIDHRAAYSMGSAYYAIYTRDLPVFVTSDSILHALHRSFDEALETLETSLFADVIDETLASASRELGRSARGATTPALRRTFDDVDLYFTTARNLLAGAGAPPEEPPDRAARKTPQRAAGAIPVAPVRSDSKLVAEVLRRIASLKLEVPEGGSCTPIYGGKRCVDWSQFRARGHYTHSAALRRYFRTMMWLGRSDLGFDLRPADPVSQRNTDPDRERRAAALAVLMLDKGGQLGNLTAVGHIVDFMIGRSDNVSIDDVRGALAHAGIGSIEDLANPAALERFDVALDTVGARAQKLRSQVLDAAPGSATPTSLPLEFQVFGQRFVIDGFALSNLVYDSIVFKGEKQLRFMPRGLDAMAALGNDEATRLLEPDLVAFKYASNLLAARRVVDEMTPGDWQANAYNQWLAAIRTLDDPPAPKAEFPRVMKREAWRRKQLRTALASWAELRHDTILYAKQSYTAYYSCEYPKGFVEPYPAFFARLRELTKTLGARLGEATVPASDPRRASHLLRLRDQYSTFFEHFSSVMARLETLATKELESQPFTREEAEFLEQTIDRRGGGGSGWPPTYTGWYPSLILDESPGKAEPVVSDVHSDPANGQVLQVATGDVQFLVVAVDNGPHRAAYVGPSYTYYEFPGPIDRRMTDEEWRDKVGKHAVPAPPAFTSVFQAPPEERRLDHPPFRRRVPKTGGRR